MFELYPLINYTNNIDKHTDEWSGDIVYDSCNCPQDWFR